MKPRARKHLLDKAWKSQILQTDTKCLQEHYKQVFQSLTHRSILSPLNSANHYQNQANTMLQQKEFLPIINYLGCFYNKRAETALDILSH